MASVATASIITLVLATALLGADKLGWLRERPTAPADIVRAPTPVAAAPHPLAPMVRFNPEDEDPSVLPSGVGRDETFHACVACHSTHLIRRTGASRARWEELLDWMSERHGMPDLGTDRALILDYLATQFAPATAAGRPNPFLRQ
jgi:hypothetical protein